MRVWLAFNSTASCAERIKDFLLWLPAGMRCEVCPLGAETGVADVVREALSAECDRLLVAGGDGTIGRVVAALAPDFPPLELGILPFGTGNDLARSLGILDEDLEEVFERATSGRPHAIDVVRVATDEDERWLANAGNGGFAGSVAQQVDPESKRRFGPLAYWMSSVSSIVDRERYEVELRLDGEPTKPFDATFTVVPDALQVVPGRHPVALARASETDSPSAG